MLFGLLRKLRLWLWLTFQEPTLSFVDPSPEFYQMKQVDWQEVANILGKVLKAKVAMLGEAKATVSFDNKPIAILWDISTQAGVTVGCSLRASIMPNEAALLVAALAINYMIMMDENFEFDDKGDQLLGEEALEYVFGQFYDRKRMDQLKQLDQTTTPRLPN